MELDRNRASKRILGLSAIERILLEYYEIESNPSDDFKCGVLERNISEWQFAVRGASGTEFEGGIYHGLVLFQREYPFKPPSIIPLTENGRFKTCTKIWLRRLNEWQPSWRVRDVFVDFIHLMPTYPDGELGSLEYSKEERRALAINSRTATPKYGTPECQKVIDVIHQYMLSKAPPVPVPQLQMTRYTPCQEEMVVDRVGSMQMESYNEIESNPSYDFTCRKLGWSTYEWQFAIRGPSGTEFEGWVYHGLVRFSEGYPSKSPSIVFLMENGCFKIQISMSSKKIQISMSSKKIQTSICLRLLWNWQSSWSVRKTLLTFIEETPSRSVRKIFLTFIEAMPTYANGELFSMRDLAKISGAATPPPKYGTFTLEQVIDQIYPNMLSKAPPVPLPQLQLTRHTPCQVSNPPVNYFKLFSPPLSFSLGDGAYMGLTKKIYVDIYLARDVIAEDKCNIKNSGEKRILEEYNEIESNPSRDFKCLKLGCNKYEWQFAIRGPSGTEFEGGIYHGVVKFSEGYPSKPPSIMFLTENGRFKIQTNISSRLLSNWQSPRSVRNALLTLIEEMPTYPDGDEELDSVKYNKEERRALAIKSRAAAPKYGTPECHKVIDVIHQYMLSNAPPVPQPQLSSASQTSKEHVNFYYFQNRGAKRKHGRDGGSVINRVGGLGVLRSMNEANLMIIKTHEKCFRFVLGVLGVLGVFVLFCFAFSFSSVFLGFWSSC